MSSNLIALVELLLVFGVVMWFGIGQLRELKKLKSESRRQAGKTDTDDASRQ